MRCAELLLVLALAGCGASPCPVEAPLTLASGTYRAERAAGTELAPYAGIASKTLVLDRQAGTVRVSYVRDGKTYEEQWLVKRVTTTSF